MQTKEANVLLNRQEIATDARTYGMTVYVSDLIDKRATEAEKANGYDIADYLILELTRRNKTTSGETFSTLLSKNGWQL